MSVDPVNPVSGGSASGGPVSGLSAASAIALSRAVGPVSAGAQAQLSLGGQGALSAPEPPDPAIAASLSSAVAEAAVGQDGLAPLYADLARAVEAPLLPADLRAKIVEVLKAQPQLTPASTGADLKAATQASGLFLEASLLAALQGAGTLLSLPGDVKAQLLQLVALLSLYASDGGAAPAPTDRRAGNRPPPPVRGGALRGERPSPPTIEAKADKAALLERLLSDSRAALSRISLSRFASPPRAGETATWRFEAPVATPAGQGFAEFEIHRDDRGDDRRGDGSGGGAAANWKARFALDIAPTGPFGAEIAVHKDALKATIWVADDAARAAMAIHLGALETTLRAEGWPNATVRVAAAPPSTPAPPSGALVDRTA
jgi:hypothetical protein